MKRSSESNMFLILFMLVLILHCVLLTLFFLCKKQLAPLLDKDLAQGSTHPSAPVLFYDTPPPAPQKTPQTTTQPQSKPQPPFFKHQPHTQQQSLETKTIHEKKHTIQPRLASSARTFSTQKTIATTQTTLPKDITFGKIARGYLKSREQSYGNLNPGERDAQSIAREMYNTRVLSLFQKTINAQKLLFFSLSELERDALLELTLSKEGKLLDCVITCQFKNNTIEQLEKKLKTNGLLAGVFPHIPNILHKDTIKVRLPLGISLSKGFERYHIKKGKKQL